MYNINSNHPINEKYLKIVLKHKQMYFVTCASLQYTILIVYIVQFTSFCEARVRKHAERNIYIHTIFFFFFFHFDLYLMSMSKLYIFLFFSENTKQNNKKQNNFEN